MTRSLIIVFMTALGFAAGYGVGFWHERHPPLPRPPGLLGSEFFRPPSGNPHRDRPINRVELVAQIDQLRPQLDAFRAKMAQIDADFERDLGSILTPEQQARHAERQKHRADGRGGKQDTSPLGDDRLAYLLRDQPAQTVLWDVVLPLRLDALTREYKLDDAQREKVRALLAVRRGKVLALIDSSPPPSVILSRMVPYVQRLAQSVPPPPPPGAGPKP